MGDLITIDKGIPAPPATRNRRYPFREMEIGDSFLAPYDDKGFSSVALEGKKRLYKSLNSSIVCAGKTTGFVFTRRKCDEGIRVWRVS